VLFHDGYAIRCHQLLRRHFTSHVNDAARALEELVESERSCCAFLGLDLARSGGELLVRITGDDADLVTLPVDL
jgi:adenosine/AMP kinase